jgi:hypothetical protein
LEKELSLVGREDGCLRSHDTKSDSKKYISDIDVDHKYYSFGSIVDEHFRVASRRGDGDEEVE